MMEGGGFVGATMAPQGTSMQMGGTMAPPGMLGGTMAPPNDADARSWSHHGVGAVWDDAAGWWSPSGVDAVWNHAAGGSPVGRHHGTVIEEGISAPPPPLS